MGDPIASTSKATEVNSVECSDSDSNEINTDENSSKQRVLAQKSASKTPKSGPAKVGPTRHFIHKYRPEWEQNQEYKNWIQPSKKGGTFFYCKVCGDDKKAGISAVKRHCKSEKHIKNFKVIKSNRPITITDGFINAKSTENKVKEAEIRIAAFIAEHNIAIRSSDHVVELIKAVCPDSAVSRKLSCDRTKCTALINNVIGKTSFEEIVAHMRENKFSILIDESTDRSSKKHLAVVVRTCLNLLDVRDEFLCLLPVSDGTAQGLYTLIKSFFEQNGIPYKSNMIGFAADGTNTMMGAHNSVQSFLKKDIPNLFIMKCICHSLALCASAAAEKLPNEVEGLVRNIYTYLQYSSKRQNELKEFQKFTDLKPHKILRPCQTRWLSLLACVDRMLEQYSALKLYFQGEYLIDSNAEEIYDQLSDPLNKLYLQFLSYALPILTDLNLEFQSDNPKVQYIYSKVETACRTILDNYIEPNYFKATDVTNIQYKNPANFTKLEDVYLGAQCMLDLSTGNLGLSSQQIQIFRTNCLNFYVECAHQMFNRFPFHTESMQILRHLNFLDWKLITKTQSISAAAHAFKNLLDLDIVALDREWRQIRNTEIDVTDHETLLSYWRKVKKLKKGDESAEAFPLINKFISFIFTLPHSTACVERIFSAVNLNKTKIRNRLEADTLTGLLQSKNLMNKEEKCCYNFEVKASMLSKHNKKMY